MLVTLFYLDRICSLNPTFTLSSLTCHRFIIASIVVSSKGLCDTFCTNELFAKVGGIPVTELNILEREFLSMIDWKLMVGILPNISLLNTQSPCYSAMQMIYKTIMSTSSARTPMANTLSSELAPKVQILLITATQRWIVFPILLHPFSPFVGTPRVPPRHLTWLLTEKKSLIENLQLNRIWLSLLYSVSNSWKNRTTRMI
jgi:hypothetical protein